MATDTSKSLFNDQIQDICDRVGISKPDAFPRWICQNILGITDEGNIDEAVSIGGKDDRGIDIFHADDRGDITEQCVYWIQAKFSENLNHSSTREEIETFANTLGHLRDCPDSVNLTFKQKSAEFIQMESKYPHIKKRMIFVVAGKLNDQAQEMVDNPTWRKEKFGNGPNSVDFEILDLTKILSRMATPHTPTVEIKFDGDVIMRTDESTNKRSIIGYINAVDLVKISKKLKEILFLENPRQTLGKTAPTYKALRNTLDDPLMKKKFWKLNNGITAICASFEKREDSTYVIKNFKVVNGRQTTYTLENTNVLTDDVFLVMTVHETEDIKERNHISEATNTQNPIKPVDLITNYPEMTDLVLQCKKDFKKFYFERQTKGFQAENKATKNRITQKRVLEKNSIARAYYAYEINPNEAMLPDKILFSISAKGNYYEKIFANRNIRDLIIPHIFMYMLNRLHKKWCHELRNNQSDKIRDKGIISKDIVKYYLLRFIYESMLSIDDSKRQLIKDGMINKFQRLNEREKDPEIFLKIAESAYNTFMKVFNMARNDTWPSELLERIQEPNYTVKEDDIPTPYDIMIKLKQKGDKILPYLLLMRKDSIKLDGDKVQVELCKLLGEN